MTEDPITEELRIAQADREAKERDAADRAPAEESEHHERRADKAAYLREKLEERVTAERDASEGEATGDEMERRSEDLAEDIEDAKTDWESKKADDAVPGAAPDEMTEERGEGR